MFLVICVVTDESEHLRWLEAAPRDFDLLLVYCIRGNREEEFKQSCEYFLKSDGKFKLDNIALALEVYKSVLGNYVAIWLPDDDIRTDTSTINTLFKKFHSSSYSLAQPSICWSRGQVNHEIFVQRKEYILRETTFVEMMAPIFKTEVLLSAPILNSLTATRSGWGCDLIWSKVLNHSHMAIFDELVVVHKPNRTTKRDGNKYYNSRI